jgi:hypothetical protein
VKSVLAERQRPGRGNAHVVQRQLRDRRYPGGLALGSRGSADSGWTEYPGETPVECDDGGAGADVVMVYPGVVEPGHCVTGCGSQSGLYARQLRVRVGGLNEHCCWLPSNEPPLVLCRTPIPDRRHNIVAHLRVLNPLGAVMCGILEPCFGCGGPGDSEGGRGAVIFGHHIPGSVWGQANDRTLVDSVIHTTLAHKGVAVWQPALGDRHLRGRTVPAAL